ncbi:hypothetical protein FGO68_gene3827 [Halteria grandinella]|uniref:Uncharacterized protein n=1 Tax=Halteria grandinella TaxID=5974 RepID=A0A8J8P5P3_HALGN|nr:hypothetical protein FGO68_gene3827 [Halteria grandinella]
MGRIKYIARQISSRQTQPTLSHPMNKQNLLIRNHSEQFHPRNAQRLPLPHMIAALLIVISLVHFSLFYLNILGNCHFIWSYSSSLFINGKTLRFLLFAKILGIPALV